MNRTTLYRLTISTFGIWMKCLVAALLFGLGGVDAYSQTPETPDNIYAVGCGVPRLSVFFHLENNHVDTIVLTKNDAASDAVFNQVLYNPWRGASSTDVSFGGWTTIANYTTDDFANAKDFATVRNEVRSTLEALSADQVLDYYALLYKFYTVSYFDTDFAVLASQHVLYLASQQSPQLSYTINQPYTPHDGVHNFEGWTVGSGSQFIDGYATGTVYENGSTVNISGDISLHVSAPEGHWLVFDENGNGATYNAPRFIKAGQTTSNEGLLEMVRNGYTFGGWYTDAACTNSVGAAGASYTPTENITIYAKWTANTYTVTYDKNTDDTTVAGIPANQTKTYATNLTLDAGVPTRDGYTFLRWNTAADGNGTAYLPGATLSTDYATGVEGDDTVTLYAIWQANTYVIEYAKGDGESGSTGSTTVRYDQLASAVLAANGFVYPGWTFTKWQDADGAQYSAGAAVTGALLLKGVLNSSDGYYHLTLTAQWKQNTSTVKIDHDNNDAVITVTQNSGTTYNVDGSFTKTGYTFNGWTLTKNGGGAPNGSVDDLTSRTPVYTFGNADSEEDLLTAQWTKNPYTIVYHYNLPGATDNTRSVTVHYDEEFHFADALYFTATGYTIDGWARTANATAYEFDCGASNLNGGVYTNLCTGEGTDTEIHLYAVWEAKHYTVTFNDNTGFHLLETETNPKDIIYNGSVTFTVQLEEGYTQATGRDIAAHISSGVGAVPDGVKDETNNTITFTVTNHGEQDIVVDTNALAKNVYTVTLQHENGSFDAATNGYNRPTVAGTVTHGDAVTFDIALLAGYHVASGSDLIASVTVGGTTVTPAVSGSYHYEIANATGDVVITLKDALKNRSTVTFDAKGGAFAGGVETVSDTQGFGGTYTVAVPTRNGYTFAGWSRVTTGENASTANGSLSGNTYKCFDLLGSNTSWRARRSDVSKPGNLSCYVRNIHEELVSKNVTFEQRPLLFTNEPRTDGVEATYIRILHRGDSVSKPVNAVSTATYEYDEVEGGYIRYYSDGLDADRDTGEYPIYSNVIVVRVRFNWQSGYLYLKDHLVGSGCAEIFQNGRYVQGAWYRESATSRLVIVGPDGEELAFQRGKSFFVITNDITEVKYQ